MSHLTPPAWPTKPEGCQAAPQEVVLTSPWVPVEWIAAHGLAPRGVWTANGRPPVAVAEGACAFARAAHDLVTRNPQTPVVFTTACDQMRRAADAAGAGQRPEVFLLNLPATWQTLVARRLYHAEVLRLGRFLTRLAGRAPSEQDVADSIRRYDQSRARLRVVLEQAPARQAAEALAGFWDSPRLPGTAGANAQPEFPARPTVSRNASADVPLALLGGPLCASQWDLFNAIEAAGGRVVLNATEPGERCLLPEVPPAATLSALCDHYFDHIVDVFLRPNTRLYDWLRPRLVERRVRGLVLWTQVGCDFWRAEAASLREAFGLPLLMLEATEGRAGRREFHRLAAFIESLR